MCIELLKPNVSALILLTTVYHQITGVFSRATFICPKVPSHCYTLKRMFWQKCSCKPHGNWVLNPHMVIYGNSTSKTDQLEFESTEWV